METDTARCTRGTATRRSGLERRSNGQTVKPSSTAPRPKHANEKPVAKTRQARFAEPESFKRVRSLDFDQQLAPADVRPQHQRLVLDGEQPANTGKQSRVVVGIAQIDL